MVPSESRPLILLVTSLIIAVCVWSVSAEAQSRSVLIEAPRRAFGEVSFGFKSGLSLSQHTGTEVRNAEYTVKSHWRTGFVAGAFLCVPVTSRFGIQQEVLYVQKGSRQDIGVKILDIPTVLDVTYDADYIEIPVLMKLTWVQGKRTTFYSLAGTALSLMVRDRYVLTGEIDDGSQVVPLRADADMSEVDMFDYSFVYGLGLETNFWNRKVFLEHRFVLGWNILSMPTYAYIPFGDERILIENDPVSLKNQAHLIMVGIAF